jgi:hypothetical protein
MAESMQDTAQSKLSTGGLKIGEALSIEEVQEIR